MKLGLRVKLLLAILPALLIMEVVVIVAYVNDRRSGYVTTNERRFEAVAHGLLQSFQIISGINSLSQSALQDSQDLLTTLGNAFYEKNSQTGILSIAILDKEEVFLTHTDSTKIGTALDNYDFHLQLGWRQTKGFLQGSVYHVLTPILGKNKDYLGVVDIAYPKSLINIDMKPWWGKSLRIAFIFLFAMAVEIFLAVHLIIARHLTYLEDIGSRILQGNLIHTIKLANSHDQIALLAQKFVHISQYLHDVTEIAQDVATGNLKHDIQKRSKRDNLGLALQDMLRYLQNVATFASRIAGGDLTEEIPLRSDVDAFGRAMRAMRMGLQTLIQQIRDSAEQLADLGSSISSLSNQDVNLAATGQSTVEKLVSIITQMGMSAEEIASNMDVLSASVEQTSASVTEMANSISSIASNSTELEQQTEVTIDALAKATSTLEGVTEKAGVSHTLSEETIQDALEGQEAVEQVTVSMDAIQQTNSSAVEAITRFAKQTADIDTILDVIDDITHQSGLLALNASIIAAQAGSHGRGFAVIADEMRNLADKVSASTKDIAIIVQTVQKETNTVVQEIHKGTAGIEQGVERTQQARQMLEKITVSAQRSSSVVTEIVQALRSMQKTTGDDMKVAMERVHSMTASITRATSEQKSSTLQIHSAVDHIRDMAIQTQSSTTQQLEGVQQVLEVANDVRMLTDQNVQSSQHIEQASNDLNTQAQLLLHSVDRFKLLSNVALAERRRTEAIRQVETTETTELAKQ